MFRSAFGWLTLTVFLGNLIGSMFGGNLSCKNLFCENLSAQESSESEWLTPAAVQRSIDGAIDYLKQAQRPDGTWEGYSGYEPGTTALILLSLLSAGVPADDPAIVRGIARLRTYPQRPDQWQTYPISLQTMVLCQIRAPEDQALIQRNVDWLTARQFRTENVYHGGWSYTGDVPESSRTDNSNSQFATLALYEAEKAGAQIPDETWTFLRDYWMRMQNEDGSWGYQPKEGMKDGHLVTGSSNGTGSMTCAGIAALEIAGSITPSGAARYANGQIRCCQPVEDELAERIDKGIGWLAEHFSVKNNPGTGGAGYLFYYLYGLERAGRLTSYRFIGKNDWYREGADFLLRYKGPLNKHWKAGSDLAGNNTIATAFALLFLSKGRWPVLISKLKYDSSDSPESAPWNIHPNELSRLTEWVEKAWGRNLIWQVIDSSKATADDYAQTPVLYISGCVSPVPKEKEACRNFIDSMRAYLEQGGFIVAEALDGDESFRAGFFELMREIFPDEEDGGLHLLPPEHPVWNQEAAVAPDKLRPLYGVDFGCRTSVIFIAEEIPPEGSSASEVRPSLSCLWELAGNPYRNRPFPAEVQAEIDAAFGIGQNILAYATGRDLKYKEEIPQKTEENAPRHQGGLFAAILDNGVGSRCAPRAIPNLMKRLETEFGIPVRTETARVSAESDDLFQYPVLFLHGRSPLRFSDAQVENLRLYFERGGFLFANTICAAPAFQESFKLELARIFPNRTLEPIPADDPLFSNRYGGFTIEKLEMRRPDRQSGKSRVKLTNEAPQLFGIRESGRWVAVFSPYDVSCALERHGSVDCTGYTEKSAYQLSINILLYAAEHL